MSDASERLAAPRVPLLAPHEFNEEQRSLTTDEQRHVNLFQLVAQHPEAHRRLKATGSFANFETQLPVRDRELMILRMAWLYQSEFEWSQHAQPALDAGLTGDDLARVKVGAEADGWDDWDRTVLRTVEGLVSDCMIPTPVWDALAERYSTEMMLELVIFFGHYTLVTTLANVFGLGVNPGKPGFDA